MDDGFRQTSVYAMMRYCTYPTILTREPRSGRVGISGA